MKIMVVSFPFRTWCGDDAKMSRSGTTGEEARKERRHASRERRARRPVNVCFWHSAPSPRARPAMPERGSHRHLCQRKTALWAPLGACSRAPAQPPATHRTHHVGTAQGGIYGGRSCLLPILEFVTLQCLCRTPVPQLHKLSREFLILMRARAPLSNAGLRWARAGQRRASR